MADQKYHRIFTTPTDNHYFFGYFNKPQVSADESKILALKVSRIDKIPGEYDNAEVGWFSLESEDNTFHVIGETKAYNWQQGSMLQFLGPDFNSRVIWNTFEHGNYCSKIFNLNDGSIVTKPPIYDVSKDGITATTIDFERHTWCRRGYSYGNVYIEDKNKPVVIGDGIWKINLSTGESHQIISLEELIENMPLNTMEDSVHYVEHMLFNDSGDYFAFLHRWKHENGIHSRLYVADINGGSLKIINDSGRMSHYCWCSNHKILGYGALPNRINSLRKKKTIVKTLFKWVMPIYKKLVGDQTFISKRLTGDSYLIMDIKNPKLNTNIVPKLRSSDGHPTMVSNGKFFITDTYARSSIGERPKLIHASLVGGEIKIIDTLNSIGQYDETPLRCDLHPRISPSGKIISIDTMNDGIRSCYAYRVHYENS